MDYTELKRLAEDAIDDSRCRHDFQMEVTPKVVLGLIKSLEHTTMAAESEAKEVDERNAVIDRLCTQNQALAEALEELTDCGAEAWGEDRPCVQDGRAALAQAEGGV